MHQETTQINAEELFGNFSYPGEFQDCRDGFEKYWQWPEEIGNGFMYMIKLRPGLVLGIGDFRIIENIAVSFEQTFLPVTLGFCATWHRNYIINYVEGQKESWVAESGYGFISYRPEWQGTFEYPLEMPIRFVTIYIDPLVLNNFMDGQYGQFPTGLCEVVNGDNKRSYDQAFTMTPSVNMAIHQIFDCPYRGALKRFYLEGKTLELITHAMAQLVVNKDGHSKTMALQPNDIERVRDAKDVLLRNLEKPPSLLELARQVGINKDKLNKDFRQVFGASVFEYLRTSRLERARVLLESKEKNVTEAAFEVGYAHPKNFARAFKNHFGTNPKDHLH